jgi:hypothetical protein
MLIGSTLMQNEPFREPVTVYLKHEGRRATAEALLDPKAENIEASRRALQRLANLTATPAAAPRRTIH